MSLLQRIFANGYQSFMGWVAGVAAIVAPSVPLIGTAFVFIFLDLFYGYRVCKKCTGCRHFESHKFYKTLEKLMLAATLIASFTLLDKFIFSTYEDLVMAKAAAGTVCFAEIISLLESLRALKPKSLIARLLTKVIKSKSEKYLEVDITDILDESQNNVSNNNNNKDTDCSTYC